MNRPSRICFKLYFTCLCAFIARTNTMERNEHQTYPSGSTVHSQGIKKRKSALQCQSGFDGPTSATLRYFLNLPIFIIYRQRCILNWNNWQTTEFIELYSSCISRFVDSVYTRGWLCTHRYDRVEYILLTSFQKKRDFVLTYFCVTSAKTSL